MYPKLLKEIDSPPEKIYYKGNWDASIFENCLAVVGSRRMTAYGKQIAIRLVSKISNAGVTIISGFMYGIDATAHKAAVDAGGRTIAVMPCGIDMVHPCESEGRREFSVLQGTVPRDGRRRVKSHATWFSTER